VRYQGGFLFKEPLGLVFMWLVAVTFSLRVVPLPGGTTGFLQLQQRIA